MLYMHTTTIPKVVCIQNLAILKGNKNKFDTRNMLGLPQDFKKN